MTESEQREKKEDGFESQTAMGSEKRCRRIVNGDIVRVLERDGDAQTRQKPESESR